MDVVIFWVLILLVMLSISGWNKISVIFVFRILLNLESEFIIIIFNKVYIIS